MIQTEKEDTEFRDYSNASETLLFIRRGGLRMLISIDKSRQETPIDKGQPEHSVKDLQALISRIETENAKP